ncbi:MAG: ACP S-malonyltransferase [Syntrophobacterales bacterium]|nr:ACP S-malonyltransferase [Syntrophobacterales bacterium]
MPNAEKSVAVVFPGQGAQRPGMGKDFCECLSVCRQAYEEASSALGWDVARMCFDGDERLDQTEFTQPCLLTTEIAMFRGLKHLYGLSPDYFGGHSLGEFTALVAAGVLPLGQAAVIVHTRGRLMQQAVPLGLGSMAAVIADGLDAEELEGALAGLPVDIANVNSPRQIVISGDAGALPDAAVRITDILGADAACRFVPLNVSAPFHSRFMRPVEREFSGVLKAVSECLNPQRASAVTSNYTGRFHTRYREDLLCYLTYQLGSRVRWRENMEILAAEADEIYEIGPGRPLRDFFKTIGVNCLSVTTLSAAARIFGSN